MRDDGGGEVGHAEDLVDGGVDVGESANGFGDKVMYLTSRAI